MWKPCGPGVTDGSIYAFRSWIGSLNSAVVYTAVIKSKYIQGISGLDRTTKAVNGLVSGSQLLSDMAC